ncbi:P2Y purinoceptor 11 [Eublepharis macularius]|uniref:P2Y purinoceptor 11 n=1 Tax=Eublepharis macularius TaxID=481883 RepID=A0AA97KP05_EUBMA|nr:P2Y purinoceptor 11 [Eublepharis macularius]XP_054859703.1 P2Y purinoceptor 11 [Eublepharis macularius]
MGLDSRTCKEGLDKFQEQLWPILTLQFILAVAGNSYAIYRFVARERSWHSGIIYSFNLAVSDLLYAFSLLPMALYYYPKKDWRYGLVFCKLDRFLFFCNLYGSTFFVACISLNRYVAIVHPFFTHGRLEPRHAKLLSGAAWLLVMAISAPVLSFSTTELKNGSSTNNTNRTECLGSASEDHLWQYWPYSLFLLAFGCGLPFMLTAFSCGAILHTVLRNQNITTAEKRKVKALICVVVALYALFYLPFHILRNLNLRTRMLGKEDCRAIRLIYTLYQLAKILVHFHICIHPLVYAALADNLQENCCRGFWRRKDVEERGVRLRLCKQDPPGAPREQG